MSKLIILTALICLALQCETQQASPEPESGTLACGAKNPTKELTWLKDIITKADEDKATMVHKGNYIGRIYLESFKNQPIFLVEMMMGSGGLAGYLFRCNGQRVYLAQEEVTSFSVSVQRKSLVYSNIP